MFTRHNPQEAYFYVINSINISSLSQFSRKNALWDYKIFEDIFYYLVNKAKRCFGEVNLFKDKFLSKLRMLV
ncbi:MAG: hypothetical protein ATN32_09265 [Candidatus Epulonipiscium fishelsonii]|nr:MAG: hypothetical protein ATN32_09265 [Epulopiscium sp. AS2M-Bin002]